MLVVGVGASAGGFDALKSILREVPPGSGIAFIVVFHLDASAHSILLQSLPKDADLVPVEAKDGMRIEPDHVYIAPGRHLVSLAGGVLRLTPVDGSERQRAPIDHFLQSLARDQTEHAVAVVLSGLGSDGALGLKAVSDAGGMTIVQEPASAQYEAMPQSALDTGAVDHVLNPASVPRELCGYRDHISRRADEKALHREVLEALPQICDILLKETGHNFKHYKSSTLLRRTLRRLHVLRLSEIHQYVDRLRSDRVEAERLFQDLLVSVTAFFRDPDAFGVLETRVIPELFAGKGPRDKVRVWVPGCATGEEAYSIAMLLKEQMELMTGPPPQVHVFATDIDEQALAIARQGRYPTGISEELAPERLERFFEKRGEQYYVKKELRDLCLFSVHNLINDPPFSKLDLISCRNLLIYLGAHLQQKLIPLFHFALNRDGYLFLGPSENIASHAELFRPLDSKHRISQRLPTAVRQAGFLLGHSRPAASSTPKPPHVEADADIDVYLIMQRMMLDEFAPRGAVVREDGKILCTTGDLEKYVAVTPGLFQNNIVRLAREGLRLTLRGALAEAAKQRRKIVREGLTLEGEWPAQLIELTVQPMPQLGENEPLYLVVFKDAPLLASSGKDAGGVVQQEVATIIEQLEQELEKARSDLEKTVQELESANEELKSSNEELLSMNEELQSANEELQTSQDELRGANASLIQANDDLENLLASTQIATIFLDDEQKIRRVTAAGQEIYNVQKSDIGRPLSNFTHRAKTMPPLPSRDDLAAVGKPIEDEIETVDGKTYLRRVMPYTTQSGTPEGTLVTFIDITQRRLVEDRLRASEALYRAIGESIDFGIWVRDPKGRGTYASESFLRLVGLSAEEWQDAGWQKILHPDERERHAAAWQECVRSGTMWDVEHVVLGADAEWHHILARGVPVRDDSAEITCWAGIHLDISRQKRTENALRESEQRFRLVADAAPVFIWMSGLDKRCTWFNRRWLDFTGRSLDEELGQGWVQGVHPDDRGRILQIYESSFDRSEPFTTEYRLRRNDGEYRWVLEHGVPLHDASGKFIGYIGSCVDTHDRKQAEGALRESEQRFRTLADSAPVLIWVAGLDGYEYVNREYLRYTGEELDGVRGMRWTEALFPEDAPAYLAAYREALQTQERFETFARLRRHDGEYRWMQSVALPRRSGSGELLGYVGCSLDVTEIKQAEEALIEGDRRKDEFLAMLAHELRNPLGAIVNANLVLSRPGLAPATREWAHHVIERQAGQLTRLVDDLLDLSRISSGKIRLQKTSLDARQVLQKAVEAMTGTFEHKRQKLTVELPEAELPVVADPARLEQIFVNLLANANKYTDAGGEVSVVAAEEKGQAVVRIIDSGVGIRRDMLPRIFDAFAQADDSLDRSQGGLGLGLTVVKHLVEEHDGSVSGDSDGPGRGSRFTVRIPLSVHSLETGDGGVPRCSAASPHKRRVLVIEDNADYAGTLALLLQDSGHTVEIVRNGRDAVSTARKFRPDVVLLDLGLPGLDGYAVAEALRKEAECEDCLIVAVSGYGQERDRKRSRAAGVDRHFTKPIDIDELLALIGSETGQTTR